MRTHSTRVILANWKNTPLTLRTTHFVAPQMGERDHSVIINNGSDDSSLIALCERLDELRSVTDPARVSLVNTGINNGFGVGTMTGTAGLNEDAVVLLGNDATTRDRFLDALLAPLDEVVGAMTVLTSLTGIWHPSILSDMEFLVAHDDSHWTRAADGDSGGQVPINPADNEVDHAGNGYDRSWLDPTNSPLLTPEIFGLCDGAYAIDTDAWRAVGGMRTNLFMYYEDTDLSYKLCEAGYEVCFIASVIVDHEHAASSGTSPPMFPWVNVRSRIIVVAQHAPWGVVTRAIARSIAWAMRSSGRGPVARGAFRGFPALPRILRRRTAPRPRR